MNTTSMTTYLVAGMTCEHCVTAVRDEIGRLDGVARVEVDLAPGSVSRVTVESSAPPPAHTVREAVAEADYELIEVLP